MAESTTLITGRRPIRSEGAKSARPARTHRLTAEPSPHRNRDSHGAGAPDPAASSAGLLLREVHHRVKNNLQVMQSLLNLEASRTSSADVTRIVRTTQDRLRAVALVHDQLHRSQGLRDVVIRDYAQAVLDGIGVSHGLDGRGIALVLRASRGVIGMNDALRIGLILNELVSNAAAHGFPAQRRGRIAVSVARAAYGRVCVKVSNTGVPLPARFVPPPDRLGLAIVANIARHSGGRFWWSRRNGASFHVELKQS